jgi:hypothetical protein
MLSCDIFLHVSPDLQFSLAIIFLTRSAHIVRAHLIAQLTEPRKRPDRIPGEEFS